MDEKMPGAKIERNLLAAFFASLVLIALAWAGFYVWCRLDTSFLLKSAGYSVGVPRGTPDWVFEGVKRMADVESLVSGEEIRAFRFTFTMGDTF